MNVKVSNLVDIISINAVLLGSLSFSVSYVYFVALASIAHFRKLMKPLRRDLDAVVALY